MKNKYSTKKYWNRKEMEKFSKSQKYDTQRSFARDYKINSGKNYCDYINKEVEKGKMLKKDGVFWKKVNKGIINLDRWVHEYCYKILNKYKNEKTNIYKKYSIYR